MKVVTARSGFKKDFKRMIRRGYDRTLLDDIVGFLRRGELLPESARLHRLSGEWEGFWECHIQFDWLLVYDVTNTEIILVGTGTHADLFE